MGRGEGLQRRFERNQRPRRFDAGGSLMPDDAVVLQALSGLEDGGTAGQLSESLGCEVRPLGVILQRLVQQGRVMEIRAGRYRASGQGGEHAATLKAAPGGLAADLADGGEAPVNPSYTLGAQAGDVVQVLIGEDGKALVTRLLRRSGREVVGTVVFQPGGPVLVPDNRKDGQYPVLAAFPKFYDRYQPGDRVVGRVEVRPGGEAGVHLERILAADTPEIEDFRHVCLLHDLPGEFPAAAVREAEAHKEQLPVGKRLDLREELVFTIDPVHAKDFDDAISLKPQPGGGWELGVHIADVSHYVRPDSALDAEAARRGTSVYLINRVIPMLPEALSNGLCSLVPRRDRYCLSAFLTLDSGCHLRGTRMAETVIHSKHRLTYEQALAILEGRDQAGEWPEDLRAVLRQVSGIAQKLRQEREKAGAINLFSLEHRFRLDVEGNPVAAEAEGTDISHQLIEECMLLANRAVAKAIDEAGLPCPYRVHPEPDAERLRFFAANLETYGIDATGIENRFGMQRLLRRLGQEPPAARLVLNHLLLRCFAKAVYQVDNLGHWALAFSHYAHFTSPIRRYPDLLAHRLIKKAIGLPAYKKIEARYGYLDALARQSSWLEQRAATSERDLHARKAARFYAQRVGEVVPGVVVSASHGGCFVQLLETGVDAFLPARSLGDDYYHFDPERLALVGRRSGKVFGPGTELDVMIASVEVARADIVLDSAAKAAAPRAEERPSRRITWADSRKKLRERR